tara:strand:- start:5629 stop:6603 length:975 start_codon:yes stop_codon:yes gene_type:complete
MNSEKLTETIKEARPNIKDNSIKMYVSNLEKLKKLFDSDNYDFLKDEKKILDKLKDLSDNTIRNYLNAILIYLMAINSDKKYDDEIKIYTDLRDELNKKYEDNQASGTISEKQKANFVDISEIYKMIETMGKEIKDRKIKKKEDLTSKDKQLLMIYIIFNIYVRLPMRNDVAGMEAISKRQYNKLSEEEKKEKNFLVVEKSKMNMILNKYKTSKKYEENKIDIPKDLEKLLRLYIRINGMGTLFKSSTGTPLSRNALSQLLIKTTKKYMDGKSISTTMLRKIYLSSKYSDVKEEMEKDAKVMGHSVETGQKYYVKKKEDDEESN